MYRFALLGDGVDYSRSPEIFRAIFDCAGVPGEFDTVNCVKEDLAGEIARLRSAGYLALSVTIPHKESVIEHLDEIDTVASAIRSVNSIRLDSEKKVGFNTDVYGFRQELQRYSNELKGSRALVLGAGGAARSAAYALALEYEVGEICFAGRDTGRLDATVATLSQALNKTTLMAQQQTDLLTRSVSKGCETEVAIIVNATPQGGPNVRVEADSQVFNLLQPGRIYYDLNYNNDNEFLLAARERGLTAIQGLPMLIHQALRSFYLWTGITVEYEAVAQKVAA